MHGSTLWDRETKRVKECRNSNMYNNFIMSGYTHLNCILQTNILLPNQMLQIHINCRPGCVVPNSVYFEDIFKS